MSYWQKQEQHYLLYVRVRPNAKQNKVGALCEDGDGQVRLRLFVTTVPENGKANKAVIKLLSKEMKCPKGAISVLKGQTASDKVLRIERSEEEFQEKLVALAKEE